LRHKETIMSFSDISAERLCPAQRVNLIDYLIYWAGGINVPEMTTAWQPYALDIASIAVFPVGLHPFL
jgi:hypothetical protein